MLTNEDIDVIFYDDKTGWHIYGSVQEEPPKVSFHKPYPHPTTEVLSHCQIGQNKFWLTSDSLMKSSSECRLEEISWPDRAIVMRNS